jgi:SIR2-like domain
MLMVIFGAGASHDSAATHVPNGREDGFGRYIEYRPPLADHLFEDREVFNGAINLFPSCKPIVASLRHLNGRSIEEVLQELQSEADRNSRRHTQLAAVRYYLHYVLWQCGQNWQGLNNGITNYLTLIDQIEDWRLQQDETVALVTFNYDTLLEDALSTVGLKMKQIDDYVNGHPRYSVFKLHGSVNWGRQVAVGPSMGQSPGASKIAEWYIDNVTQLSITSDYFLVRSSPPGLVNGVAMFPAIAIPVESKNQFECPSAHLEKLERFLPHVRKLLIVGWRGMETHFMRLLQVGLKAPLDVMIVSKKQPTMPSDAENLRERIRAILAGTVPISDDSCTLWEHGFSNFVTNRAIKPLLSPE